MATISEIGPLEDFNAILDELESENKITSGMKDQILKCKNFLEFQLRCHPIMGFFSWRVNEEPHNEIRIELNWDTSRLADQIIEEMFRELKIYPTVQIDYEDIAPELGTPSIEKVWFVFSLDKY